MTHVSDVIVIGGGIAGIGAAAHLSSAVQVTVLEAEGAIGHHSTGRSAAIFIKNYGNSTLRKLNAASEPFLMNPVGVCDETLLTPRGQLLIANADEVAEWEAYLEGSDGMERLTPAQAVELVPILKPDQLAAVAYESAAQDIDVDRLLQGYARKLRRDGGHIALNAAVETITYENGQWKITACGQTYQAPVVVNAAGAWADHIAQKAGVATVGLVPMRRSAAIIPAPEGHDVSRWPMVASAANSFYAKPEAGKIMVSPADEDPVEPHDAWADDMVLAEGLHRYEQAVTSPVTRVEHNWAGLRSFVADRSPVAGFAPSAQGFFWLAAQGGYGVQTAPAMSQLTADLILNRTPALDAKVVQALSPERFH